MAMKENQQDYRKFSLYFIGWTLLLVGAVGLFNYLINPYAIYQPPVIKGVNDHFPAAQSYGRLYKAEGMKRVKPDLVITGTSRADIGLNPDIPALAEYTSYNLALSAATIFEQRMNLEYAYHLNPPKLAVITLDFFAFNANRPIHSEYEPNRLSREALLPVNAWVNSYGTIWSVDTISTSLKHLRRMRKKERYSYPRPNGHKVHLDGLYQTKMRGAHRMFSKPPAASAVIVQDFELNYRTSAEGDTLIHLAAMLDLARQHKTKVIVLFSPFHETHHKVLKAKKQWPLFLEWKKRVIETVRHNGEKYQEQPYALWDFTVLHPYISEPVPSADNRDKALEWFWDSFHYKEELGDVIWERILGTEDQTDFGVQIKF